jgi:hypothetical protein
MSNEHYVPATDKVVTSLNPDSLSSMSESMKSSSSKFAEMLGITLETQIEDHPLRKKDLNPKKKKLQEVQEKLQSINAANSKILNQNFTPALRYDDVETNEIKKLYEEMRLDEHPFTVYFQLEDVLRNRELRTKILSPRTREFTHRRKETYPMREYNFSTEYQMLSNSNSIKENFYNDPNADKLKATDSHNMEQINRYLKGEETDFVGTDFEKDPAQITLNKVT